MIGQSLGRYTPESKLGEGGMGVVFARSLGTVRPGLTVSRDGRTIYFTRVDAATDELMLVENFQ
jgi:hypothetical protein